MPQNVYFDVEVRTGTDLSVPVVLSSVVQVLHAAGLSGRYAVGFPGLDGITLGNSLRVFAPDASILKTLQDKLSGHPIDDDVKVRRIESVPTVHNQMVYRAIKPDLASKVARRTRRVAKGQTVQHVTYTDADIQRAIDRRQTVHERHAFLRVWSMSQKKWMVMYLVSEKWTGAGAVEETTANSYGFSTRSLGSPPISTAPKDAAGRPIGGKYLCLVPSF